MIRFLTLFMYGFLTAVILFPHKLFAEDKINIPILCYHNFNPVIPGSMNLTPKKFEAEIQWLKQNGFTIIPLSLAVSYLQGRQSSLPEKPVVISFDDGWQSVYKYIVPIVKKYHFPATLFIYPQTISVGKNAMSWDELKELKQTGLFDIQSHTYSHPNFKQEKKRLSAMAYEKNVKRELINSKKILDEKLGINVSLLAWPFGIYDKYLEQEALQAGYVMAFSIDALPANRNHRAGAQPRFMIIDAQSLKTFAAIMNGAVKKH